MRPCAVFSVDGHARSGSCGRAPGTRSSHEFPAPAAGGHRLAGRRGAGRQFPRGVRQPCHRVALSRVALSRVAVRGKLRVAAGGHRLRFPAGRYPDGTCAAARRLAGAHRDPGEPAGADIQSGRRPPGRRPLRAGGLAASSGARSLSAPAHRPGDRYRADRPGVRRGQHRSRSGLSVDLHRAGPARKQVSTACHPRSQPEDADRRPLGLISAAGPRSLCLRCRWPWRFRMDRRWRRCVAD